MLLGPKLMLYCKLENSLSGLFGLWSIQIFDIQPYNEIAKKGINV